MEDFSSILCKNIMHGNTIVIATHVTPDGDAVGSAMAMAMITEKFGKKPIVVIENYSDKFNFINGKQFIYNGNLDEIEPDVFIALDCADKARIGNCGSLFEKAKVTFNIDHHISNNEYADYNMVCANASSACEVLFDIAKYYNSFDKNIAEAIYTGIVTDTCAFKHKSTTPNTHKIASKLIGFNIDFSEIQRKLLYEKSFTEVMALNKALCNLRIKGKIAYTSISKDEMKESGITYNDLDGIVGYILNIDGIDVSLFVYEKPDNIKVSLRSSYVNVNKVASVFGGGGHILASGANMYDTTVDEAIEKVLKELEKELVEHE